MKEEAMASARDKKAVWQLLNEAKDYSRLEKLLQATESDQGQTFHLASKYLSSSHWIKDGAFTSIAEYRFAIKGTLNLLPTSGNKESRKWL